MKRKVLAVLLLLTLLMLGAPTGVVAAKNINQKIEFNLEGKVTVFDEANPYGYFAYVTVNFAGKINDKDGTLYLSPLKGTITIDETEYQSHLRPAKGSEPVYHTKFEIGDPDGFWYMLNEEWICVVEINIEGKKSIGILKWYEYLSKVGDNIYEDEGSTLRLWGILDGKYIKGEEHDIKGDLPEIN